MIVPARPVDEVGRCSALAGLHLLDTPTEERFDRITGRLAELLDLPIAYVALLDGERQWLKSRVGEPPVDTPRDLSFCAHTILRSEPLVVHDTLRDPRFFDNPMVVGEPGIRFYAGFPLESGGHNVGTLCVADRRPRELSFGDLETLRAYAALVEGKLNAPPEVFISYSHADEEWKDTVVRHLSVLQRQELLNVWDDRRIGVGEQWKNDIQQAMEASNVAVLLVSASFLTSQFILGVEVPRLLERRDREGIHVLPLLLTPCCWTCVEWLESMNLFPVDGQPLASRTDYERDRDLASFTSLVLERVRGPRRLSGPGGAAGNGCAPCGPGSVLAAPVAAPPAVRPSPPRAPETHPRTAPPAGAPRPAGADPAAGALPAAVPAAPAPVLAAPAAVPAALAAVAAPAAAATLVRIHLARRGSADDAGPLVFRQSRVILGRAADCDVELTDDARSVSRHHAAVTREGDGLFVTDLGSRNRTLLDGQPLEPDRPRPLPPGGVLTIGEYEVRAEAVAEDADDLDATLLAAGARNPFRDEAHALSEPLRRIAALYRAEPAGRRDEALAEALGEALAGEPDDELRPAVAQVLGGVLDPGTRQPLRLVRGGAAPGAAHGG